jgi:hypothetical protein
MHFSQGGKRTVECDFDLVEVNVFPQSSRISSANDLPLLAATALQLTTAMVSM